jgi:hypothetical protein
MNDTIEKKPKNEEGEIRFENGEAQFNEKGEIEFKPEHHTAPKDEDK